MQSIYPFTVTILMGSLFLLVGCTPPERPTNFVTHGKTTHHAIISNARNHVSWTGTYQGIFPCTGCEGVAIMLKLNQDMTYSSRTRRLGKENIDRKSNGTFIWQRDNSHIILQEGASQKQIFRVDDGFVQLIGADGKEIPNKNPEAFYLEKTD